MDDVIRTAILAERDRLRAPDAGDEVAAERERCAGVIEAEAGEYQQRADAHREAGRHYSADADAERRDMLLALARRIREGS